LKKVGQAVSPTSAASGPNAGTNLPVTVYSPFPIYVVGPATSGTLSSLLDACARAPTSILKPLRCQVFGASTGNGEALAGYILEHYNELPGVKLPLLFLVGEQRRDVIPRNLMFPSLPPAKQIKVDELVVYETGIMSSFPQEFAKRINMIDSHPAVNTAVVVVFSPSGCGAMLTCLGLIDQHNQLTRKGRQHGEDCQEIDRARGETQYVVTTIGPTTKNYLRSEFGFAADVCARSPSPKGVVEGILEFLRAERTPRSLS
jgi:uroporphyrinogen-III synthase